MNKKNSLLLPPQFFETDSDKKIRTILDLGVDALYLFDHFKNPTDSTKPTYIFTAVSYTHLTLPTSDLV